MNETTSGTLDDYLQQVRMQLKGLPPVAREGELREVEGHLLAMIESRQACGASYHSAVGESIQQFGNARRVGRDLVRAWRGRQPESVVRPFLAFSVALVIQLVVANAAMAFANFLWFKSAADAVSHLPLLIVLPLVSGLVATVIAPRRGLGAAIMAYGAVTAFCLFFTFSRTLESAAYTRDPLAYFLRVLFDGLSLTIECCLASSIAGILAGTWLGRRWNLQRATHHQLKLQPVGGFVPNSKGDDYGS